MSQPKECPFMWSHKHFISLACARTVLSMYCLYHQLETTAPYCFKYFSTKPINFMMIISVSRLDSLIATNLFILYQILDLFIVNTTSACQHCLLCVRTVDFLPVVFTSQYFIGINRLASISHCYTVSLIYLHKKISCWDYRWSGIDILIRAEIPDRFIRNRLKYILWVSLTNIFILDDFP